MFSKDFVWGAATSSYQIEGNHPDIKGKCVWDEFTKVPGTIEDGSNGEIACDHINRYKEDYKLMASLGIKHYRFSVSWAKIMPEGIGRVDEKAVKLYRDMIVEMKKNDIIPYLTLFHWEYPQVLMEQGGWLNPKSPEWFYEYAKVIAENFSDICDYFFTINEPQCIIGLGYIEGVHAPGLKLSKKETFLAAHNLLKAHGLAVKALRKYGNEKTKVGIAPTAGVAYPYTEEPCDIEAARSVYLGCDWPEDKWCWNVTWFLDAVVFGQYPKEALEKYKEYLPEITKEDMELISQPIDYMGQNIYNGYFVRAIDGGYEYVDRPSDFPTTSLNWPVTPEVLYWGPKFLYERYKLPIYITENGAAYRDTVTVEDTKKIHDSDRTDFLRKYLLQLERAVNEGIDIRGYFLWSLMDNFEWNCGYTQRFGIVYVDYATQERICKDSAYFYKNVCESNGECLNEPL